MRITFANVLRVRQIQRAEHGDGPLTALLFAHQTVTDRPFAHLLFDSQRRVESRCGTLGHIGHTASAPFTFYPRRLRHNVGAIEDHFATGNPTALRSEEHTSELQS